MCDRLQKDGLKFVSLSGILSSTTDFIFSRPAFFDLWRIYDVIVYNWHVRCRANVAHDLSLGGSEMQSGS